MRGVCACACVRACVCVCVCVYEQQPQYQMQPGTKSIRNLVISFLLIIGKV